MERYLQHLVRQQAANHREQVQIQECLYHFSRSQQGQSSTPFVCPTPEQFGLRSHCLETGPMPRQGRSLQDPPEGRMNPLWMKI